MTKSGRKPHRSSRRRSAQAVRYLLAGLSVWFAGPACSEDEGNDEIRGNPADCVLIANRCHKYDEGSGLPHDCHETGHDGASPVACTKMRARCLAECPETDGGSGGSAGASGADAGVSGSAGNAGSGGLDASGGSAGASGGSAGQTSTGGTGGIAHDSGASACDQLANLCHGVATPFAEQCHELGHDGNEPACAVELAACLAACIDAGP